MSKSKKREITRDSEPNLETIESIEKALKSPIIHIVK
jgi:hypothetical protein